MGEPAPGVHDMSDFARSYIGRAARSTPPGRVNADDVFVPHVGWVSRQLFDELIGPVNDEGPPPK